MMTRSMIRVASSTTGELLATGSHDRLHVWAVKVHTASQCLSPNSRFALSQDWQLLRTFKSQGGITDVSWSPSGDLQRADSFDAHRCV